MAILADLGSEPPAEPFILCLARLAGQPETGGGKQSPPAQENCTPVLYVLSKSHGQKSQGLVERVLKTRLLWCGGARCSVGNGKKLETTTLPVSGRQA